MYTAMPSEKRHVPSQSKVMNTVNFNTFGEDRLHLSQDPNYLDYDFYITNRDSIFDISKHTNHTN